MRYYPQSAKGFVMNKEVAEKLELADEWEEWDGEQAGSNFGDEFEGKYGVMPTYIIHFKEKKGGEISGLTGFADRTTYILFDSDESGEAWDKLVAVLTEQGISLDSGSWAQLG